MTDSRMESKAASSSASGRNGGTAEFGEARSKTNSAYGDSAEIESASSSAKPAVDRLTVSAHETVDKISDVASHAVETLGLKGEQIGDLEKRMLAGTRKYVQDYPVASVGIALFTGYVLSRVLTSR
jgi:hypothetical protein